MGWDSYIEEKWRNGSVLFIWIGILLVLGGIWGALRRYYPSEIVLYVALGALIQDYVVSKPLVKAVGRIGLILLVFRTGLLARYSARQTHEHIVAWTAVTTVVGMALPYAMAYLVMLAYNDGKGDLASASSDAAYAAVIMMPTSMSISLQYIIHNNLQDTLIGKMVAMISVLDDLVTLVVFSAIRSGGLDTYIPIVATLAVTGLIWGYFRLLGPALANVHVYPDSMLGGMAMVLAVGAFFAGLFATELLGAFLVGYGFSHTSMEDLHRKWIDIADPHMNWMLKIFFLSVGLGLTTTGLDDIETWGVGLAVASVAVLGKALSGAFFYGTPAEKALGGWLLVPRAELALYMIQVLHDDDLISSRTLAIFVAALLWTDVIFVMFTWIFQYFMRRDGTRGL
jgi:Kef-type K+ transport system membrane component KefB